MPTIEQEFERHQDVVNNRESLRPQGSVTLSGYCPQRRAPLADREERDTSISLDEITVMALKRRLTFD